MCVTSITCARDVFGHVYFTSPVCNEDETNEVMEALAEHDFRTIWAHRSDLHNGR